MFEQLKQLIEQQTALKNEVAREELTEQRTSGEAMVEEASPAINHPDCFSSFSNQSLYRSSYKKDKAQAIDEHKEEHKDYHKEEHEEEHKDDEDITDDSDEDDFQCN